MRPKRLSLPLLLAILRLHFQAAAADGWTNLFNGRDLAAWIQRGGKAIYTIEKGEIVGTGNSFLCTARDYGNFILEYDFKVDPRLNSGVQIRSQCFDEPKEIEWQGKKISIPAGRVHGYQVEIDPTGFIALQVHGIGNDESKQGTQVRWRNLRIKEL